MASSPLSKLRFIVSSQFVPVRRVQGRKRFSPCPLKGAWLLFLAMGCADPHFSEGSEGGQPDSNREPDAGVQEARQVHTWPCTDDPNVLGGECPLVVSCTAVGLCDIRGNRCCVTQTTATCSAVSDCGSAQPIACDGPEDCVVGEVCCLQDGALRCADASACAVEKRACHRDADCGSKRCLEGLPGTFLDVFDVLYFAGGGMCRGS